MSFGMAENEIWDCDDCETSMARDHGALRSVCIRPGDAGADVQVPRTSRFDSEQSSERGYYATTASHLEGGVYGMELQLSCMSEL